MQLDLVAEAQIAAVMAYASARPETRKDLADRLTGRRRQPPGSDPGNQCHVNVAGRRYSCVYSLEEQPRPIGMCRHVSFSSADGGEMRLDEVNALIWRFGLRRRLTTLDRSETTNRRCLVWIETHNGLKIINLLEPIEEQPDEQIATVQALPGAPGVYIEHRPEKKEATR